MEDPPCTTIPIAGPPRETKCRRACWQPGRLVLLSDGQSWSIPPISVDLLELDPDLLANIGVAFGLARAVRPHEPESAGQSRTIVRYHARLAQIALILLRINYDLTDDPSQSGGLGFLSRLRLNRDRPSEDRVAADWLSFKGLGWVQPGRTPPAKLPGEARGGPG